MAESKVNREHFITVQGWMITDLKLKGNELLIYACIYGFSQAENQTFSGSLQYLADWTNSTKQSVMKCLKSLVEKGLLVKKDNTINGVKFCEYYATKFNTLCNKVVYPMQQSLTGGMQQSLPNNIDINTIEKNIEDKIDYQRISTLYNTICVSYPKIKNLSENRKKAIKARLKSYTYADFETLFTKAEASSFLKGANERNWSADFDWLIKDANMAKVLEGKYDHKHTPVSKPANNNKFNNFTPRQYEMAAVERMLLKAQNPPKTAGEDENIRKRMEEVQKLVNS